MSKQIPLRKQYFISETLTQGVSLFFHRTFIMKYVYSIEKAKKIVDIFPINSRKIIADNFLFSFYS